MTPIIAIMTGNSTSVNPRTRVRSFGLGVLLGIMVGAAASVSAESPAGSPDKTGILKTKLTQYLKTAQDFEEERSYVMAKVDLLRVSPGEAPKTDAQFYVTANEPATKSKLRISSVTVETDGVAYRESWDMMFISPQGTFRRGGFPQWGRDYRTIELDEDGYEKDVPPTELRKLCVGYVQPVHSAFINPWNLFDAEDRTSEIEGGLQYDGYLKTASYDRDGNIIAVFESAADPSRGAKTVWERVLAKAAKFMPSEQRLYHEEDAKRLLVAQSKTQWGMQAGRWLPQSIEAVTFNGPIETRYSIDFTYLVGESCPADNVLDITLKDWREPLRKLFDIDWEGSELRYQILFGVPR